MPIVSVILPNYNHALFLQQRIDSILNQTFQDFELIILDDCSTDNSKEIIEKYRKHEKVTSITFNEVNSGSTFNQWNKGIALAKGEIIWLAESDDFSDQGFLNMMVPYFKQDANIGLAYCQSYRYNGNSEITGNWKSWTEEDAFNNQFRMDGKDYIDKYLIYKNTIPNASAVLFRKKVYQQIGGADTTIINCSDWLTWIKMLSVSNIVYTPEFLNYFRYHENSVISKAVNDSADTYIDRFQRIMRESLHNFFKVNAIIRNNCKAVYHKNRNLLISEYEAEGLFEIQRKNFLAGWVKIFQATFNSGTKMRIVKRAASKSLKVLLRRPLGLRKQVRIGSLY